MEKQIHTSPSVKRVTLSATQEYEPSVFLSITCQGPAHILIWIRDIE